MGETHGRRSGRSHGSGRSLQPGGASADPQEHANDSSIHSSALLPAEQYFCPLCEGILYVNQRVGRWSNRLEWFYFCFSCEADGLDRKAYNAALNERGIQPRRLKDGDFAQLGKPLGRTRANAPAPPSSASIDGWHSALLSSRKPLAYLRNRRGLTLDTLSRFGVGWDRDRRDLTFPAWEDSQPVYLYRRKPVDGAKMIASGGPRPPYPDLPPEGALALVAGEIDALIGRQIGLRAVTVNGKALPPHAISRFAGRRVYVMFDVGEEEAAGRVAEKLNAVGASACVARLSTLGLPDKADLNDLYRKCGVHTRTVLESLFCAERGRRAA